MVIIWSAPVGGLSFFETHLGTAGLGPQLAHAPPKGRSPVRPAGVLHIRGVDHADIDRRA